MDNIKVITNNVRGISNYEKRRNLFHFYCTRKIDIIILQEIHSVKKTQSVWNTQWGSKVWFSHGMSAARGVAILIRKNLLCTVHNIITDTEGRSLLLYVTLAERKVLITNIYAIK